MPDIEPQPMDHLLARWREAQIRLEIAKPGSLEATRAVSDIERPREEYQMAHEAIAKAP